MKSQTNVGQKRHSKTLSLKEEQEQEQVKYLEQQQMHENMSSYQNILGSL